MTNPFVELLTLLWSSLIDVPIERLVKEAKDLDCADPNLTDNQLEEEEK